jgi:hypothetical protein
MRHTTADGVVVDDRDWGEFDPVHQTLEFFGHGSFPSLWATA